MKDTKSGLKEMVENLFYNDLEMQLYNLQSKKLELVKEKKFGLEKEMQSLTEKNIEKVFGLEFINTEFQLNNLRIDTLSFDNDANSFVIIEYKRWSSYSVVDQWMSYLSLMLNNKADFVQELSRKRDKFIDVKDIEWSQSRVIIVADSFNRYQKESINFKDLPIELYELKAFDNNVIVYNPIRASNTSESIKTVTDFKTEYKEVSKEIKTYRIEDLIKPNWDNTRELFEELREFVLGLDENLVEKINKPYVWYKNGFQNLIGVNMYKFGLHITFVSMHKEDFNDYKDMIKNVPVERKWWKKSGIDIKNQEDLDYAKELIKQAHKVYLK